jgi:hypothetical protein
MAATGLVFEVRKSDWKATRFVEGPAPDLAAGPVLFRRGHPADGHVLSL